MGNGAIIPFLLSSPDDSSDLARAAQNIETIRHFYERVYVPHLVDAADSLVKDSYQLHRDGLILEGLNNLKELIEETFSRRKHLQVEIGQIVASTSHVAYTLKITYTNVLGHRFRVNGLSMSRIEDDLIAATWVTYEDPVPDS
jgi:hypothetical protein